MNYSKFSIFILLLLFLTGCEKLDLPRDNPNDEHFNGDESKLEAILSFSTKYVACKPYGKYDYTDENVFRPGERIWLMVKMKNIGHKTVYGVKGEISSQSKRITIAPKPKNMYLNFAQLDSWRVGHAADSIGVGESGFGENTDGERHDYAPNYNSYSIEFQIDSLASVGEKIDFQIDCYDRDGNTWTDTFAITLED